MTSEHVIQRRDTPEAGIPPMDFARVEMVAGTDAEKAELLALFFGMADTLVSAMDAARRGDDFLAWRDTAHSLKGAAANLSMAALESLCREAEAAQPMDGNARAALLGGIENEIRRVRAYIGDRHPALLPHGY